MKVWKYLLFLFLCGLSVCVNAQSGKKLVKSLQEGVERSAANTGRAGAVCEARQTVQKLERTVGKKSDEVRRNIIRRGVFSLGQIFREEVERHIRQSIFQVIVPKDGSTRGSGFVFERDGQIWGIVSYHVSGRAGNRLKMRFYKEDGTAVYYFGYVASSGSYGFNGVDAALVSLPQEVKEHVKPLVISQRSAQKNTIVDSFGFPDPDFSPKDYSKNAGRRILDVCGYKIITTLPPAGSGNGACGGPLLNERGEVVGIHSGSFKGTLGFAVDAKTGIDDLFSAMDNQGKVLRPLIFNGIKITDINISENIGLVEIRRDGKTFFSRDFKRYPGSLDYRRLERVIPAKKGDKVFLFLNQGAQEARLEVYEVR